MKKAIATALLGSCLFLLSFRLVFAAESGLLSSLGFSSVATTDDALALLVNPAGLGVGRGLQACFLHTYSDTSLSGDNGLAFSLGSLGFSGEHFRMPGGGHARRYTVGLGSR